MRGARSPFLTTDPEHEVNQPVARSQTEDCYHEIPRDSIWPEVRGWKTQLHGSTVPRESEGASVCSNESIDKFGISTSPAAALSPAVTFHLQRILSCDPPLAEKGQGFYTLRSRHARETKKVQAIFSFPETR